ncbi:hypothetical protein SRHO_G00187100 [Serrasalmus rhombeus]
MSMVLEDVIHPDQVCAVPGRKITDSLVLIQDAICFARDRNIRLLVLNLDFEKAFDRVSHQFLFKVLQKMGFPGRFLGWVGLLYKDINSRILVNGHLSKAITVHSGVRQGCPLSPLLFVACIEPLAQILRKDKWIKGLDLPGGLTATCTLYMDDVTLLCSDVLTAQRALDLTDWYGRASGAKLNKGKSEAQLFGPWGNEPTHLDVVFKENYLKILGLKFDKEGGGQGLERVMFYFLWGSKWERLRRDVIKKRKENGGKGLPDPYLFLTSKFVALHIQYATTPPRDNKTEAMAKFWMGSYLRSLGILTLDLRSPVAFSLPKEYAFIKKFLKEYELEREDVTILTNAKSLVSLVQDWEEVSPVPGLTLGEAKQVWKNAAHPALQNRLKDMAWMAAHEVLPVRAVMHSRGMAKNPTCPQPGCGQPETVRHVLWECSVARDLWALTGPLQCPSLPAGVVHPRFYRLAVNGVGQSISNLPVGEFTSLWLTLMSVTSALWTARNLLVGKRVMVSLHAILRLATSSRQGASRAAIRRRGLGSHVGRPRPSLPGAPIDAPP